MSDFLSDSFLKKVIWDVFVYSGVHVYLDVDARNAVHWKPRHNVGLVCEATICSVIRPLHWGAVVVTGKSLASTKKIDSSVK